MDNTKFPFEKEKPDAGTGPAAGDAGSVTSMFATPVAPKAQTSTEDLLAELLKPKAAAPSPAPPAPAERIVPAVPPLAPKPPVAEGKKGDVTRLLEQLQAAAPLRPPAAPAAKVATSAATDSSQGEFTRIFTQLPTPQPKPPAPAPPLQAVQPAPVPPSPPVPAPPVASAQQPGEFTQFLQKMSAPQKGEPDAGAAPVTASGGWPAGLPVEPSAPLREAPKPSSEPGSFTQLFQAVSKGGAAAAPPSAPAPVEAAAPAAGPGAFTQMFQSISAKPEPLRPAPLQEPPKSAPVSQGGFTQLFDSLASSAPAHRAPASPLPMEKPFTLPSAPISQPMPASGGEFTRLMRTLSDPPAATPASANMPPMAPAGPQPLPQSLPQAAPMPQSGPGEFTRIISSSALREAGMGGAFPPLAPSSAPPPGRAAAPAALPQLPHLKPPAMPHAPAAPAGFGLPQAFAPPPAPAPAPAPQSKLQQYLPLIVVLNVAVLLIVVLILIFAVRHH